MTPTDVTAALTHHGYLPDEGLSTAVFLALQLQRPLLLEGDAGVGKTEVAQALARVFDCPLIRLQCYEGLDVNAAVYEWNYQHQLLAIKLLEQGKVKLDQLVESDIGPEPDGKPGLSATERQWLQIQKAAAGDHEAWIEVEELRAAVEVVHQVAAVRTHVAPA